MSTPKVWTGHRGLTLGLLAAGLLGALTFLFSTGLLVTSGALIRSAAERPPILDLMLFFVGVRFFGLGRAVLRYAERMLSHDLIFRQLKKLRVLIFENWTRMSAQQSSRWRSADLLQRWTTELERLQEAPLRVFLPVIAGVLLSLTTIPLLALVSVPAAVFFAAVVLWLTIVWPSFCAHVHGQTTVRRRLAAGKLQYRLAEGRYGRRDLLMQGANEEWREDLDRRLDQLKRLDLAEARLNGWQDTVGIGTSLAGQGILLWILTPAAMAGAMGWPLLVGIVLGFVAALEGVQGFATVWTRRAEMRAISRRLFGVETIEINAPGTTPALTSTIRLENLAFAYGHRTLFRNFNLTLPAQGSIAITGPSGTGKTTLLKTLAGLLESSEGRIGANNGALTPDTRRGLFSICLQDVTVFRLPLRENLALGDDTISDAAMRAMLEKVGLWQRFASTPDPLASIPGEDGTTLSGGEIKRLGLARAFLQPPRRLILDEPFEHLDTGSIEMVANLIEERAKESLVLVVTHQIPSGWIPDQTVPMERITSEAALPV